MARTFIQAIAQPTSNSISGVPDFKGITADNCTTYIQQSITNFMGPYRNIIEGDGVNGDQVGKYPYNVPLGRGEPAGDISKIFEYLNAGGSNIKYTKITFTVLIDLLTASGGNVYRELYKETTYEFEIYWGKYILYKENYPKVQDGKLTPPSSRDQHPYVGDQYQIAEILTDISGELTLETKKFLTVNLDTKKIIGLPFVSTLKDLEIPSGYPEELNGERARNLAWTIETDDFATTVTAPAPQEDPVEIEGTKISELESATTLQDDDLVVISRDEGSDGSFDVSYNTSLSDLAAKIVTSNGWSSGWVNTDGTTSVADGADLNFQHNLGTTDVIIQVYAAIDASGTNSINVSQHEISQTDIPRSDYGCQILPSLNSVQVVLASQGLNIPDIGATYNVSSESYSTYNYIKVVAVKI